ncbi:MAG: hypothetical protein M3Y36_10740 [Actinomycetota bacterium]|nr:hypothetical protein [Actinomycetota bacterium]
MVYRDPSGRQLEPIGGEWAIVDDGLSRRGTMVNIGQLQHNEKRVALVGEAIRCGAVTCRTS